MRYIRFLKTPRVVTEKRSLKKQICCLITISSDLGDSFLPYDVELVAEIISSDSEHVKVWQTIQWTAGMRSLPINFPVAKAYASSELRIRVGLEPRSTSDEYNKLSEDGFRGIVSAWSASFSPAVESKEALKLVERRFAFSKPGTLNIWEETGESIARHLW